MSFANSPRAVSRSVFPLSRTDVSSDCVAANVAYLLTTSALPIVPLAGQLRQGRPQVNPNGVVNVASYQTSFAPESVSIFGQNLAAHATPDSSTLPVLLNGPCVTIDNNAAPLLMTSPGQINIRLPPDLTAARYTLVVRPSKSRAVGPAGSDPTGQGLVRRPELQAVRNDVEWSGLVPGLIGVYRIDIRVPGDRLHGDSLRVTLLIGGVDTPKTGAAAAKVAVD